MPRKKKEKAVEEEIQQQQTEPSATIHEEKEEEKAKENSKSNESLILGLDVSTTCIGCCVIKYSPKETLAGDFSNEEIIDLAYIKPKAEKKPQNIIEQLFLKKEDAEKELHELFSGYTFNKIAIEEPLLGSNNINTVATLLKFNGMLSESIYRWTGIVPDYISSYDARRYSFPELLSIRTMKGNGEAHREKQLIVQLKKNELSLFADYPLKTDKKEIMWQQVSKKYPSISWEYDKNGKLKQHNFDICDSIVVALGIIHKKTLEGKEVIVESFDMNGNNITFTASLGNYTFTKTITTMGF